MLEKTGRESEAGENPKRERFSSGAIIAVYIAFCVLVVLCVMLSAVEIWRGAAVTF